MLRVSSASLTTLMPHGRMVEVLATKGNIWRRFELSTEQRNLAARSFRPSAVYRQKTQRLIIYLVKLLGRVDVSCIQDVNLPTIIQNNRVSWGRQLFFFCTECIRDSGNQLLKRKRLFDQTSLWSDAKRTSNFSRGCSCTKD
jgi:hypothetical protein